MSKETYKRDFSSVAEFLGPTAVGLVLMLVITASPAAGIPIGPLDFGPGAEVEDFEELANVVFTEVLPPSNPHYVVTSSYSFNGDFSLTHPNPNPPEPGNVEGAVVIGDFTQGTQFWGLGYRELNDPSDVHSGSAYLGGVITPTGAMTFTFNSGLLRVGAWVDGYSGNLVTLSVLDINGSVIESVATMPPSETFLGIESQTPIWGVSISGYVPVVDDLTYEVPEPSTIAVLGLGALSLIRLRRKAL